MKKILLIILSIFLLTSCERRIKDYAKYISPSFLNSELAIYAPEGVLTCEIITAQDSTFAGIAFDESTVDNRLFIQPENFCGKVYARFISPGYFRVENKNNEKCELAVGQQECLIRIVSQSNIYIQLPDSCNRTENRVSGKLYDQPFQLVVKNCDIVIKDSSAILTPYKLPAFIFYSLQDNAKPNWNFEHYYLNTLQQWNRALNAIQFQAKDKSLRTPFYTAMYKALAPVESSALSQNYAERLFNRTGTNSDAQFIFAQLGILHNHGELKFITPSCKSATIAFGNTVKIVNQTSSQFNSIIWNGKNTTSLKVEELQQGGTLIFK